MAGRRGNFNPFNTGGRGNAIPNMVRPSVPSFSVDKPVSSPQVVNPDSLFSDPGMGGGQMREIMNILPTLPPAQIAQLIPQLPPEVIKEVIPRLPPQVIREVAPQLPPEVIREVIPQLPPEIAQEIAPPEVLEAVKSRRDANEATRTATDQYEADVADFKSTQATEAEQGIAGLPQLSEPAGPAFDPRGIGSFTPRGVTPQPPMAPRPFDPFMAGGKGQIPPAFDPDSLFSDPFMGGEPPIAPPRFEPPMAPPPMAPPPMAPPRFQNPFMGGQEPNVPPMAPPPPMPPGSPISPAEPPMNASPGGGSFYDDLFGGNPFIGVEPPIRGPFMPPPPVDLGTGESSDNTGTVPPRGGGRPPRVPNLDLINGGGEESGNSYPGNPMGPGFQLPPDFGGGLPYLPDDDEPFDPGYDDPPPGGGLPPGGEPLPQPPPYDGPINIYTGEPIEDPYQPYATDSGATPLVRKMTPEQFGQAPGMGPPLRTMPYPQGPFPMPPPMPPMDSIGYPEQRLGMFNGGYLNTGISQLPTNQQGDTLTRQVFQSGFRPRS